MNLIYKLLNSKIKYYWVYTIAFTVLFSLIVNVFVMLGKAPVWSADSISQHYPGYIYSGNWFRQFFSDIFSGFGQIKQWDMTIGLGQDVFNVVSFKPSSFFSVFFSEESTLVYIWISLYFRFFCVGICFSEYCLYMKFDRFSSLCATILYSFSSYSLVFGVKHYFFVDMMLFLPWLCLGVERIFDGKKVYTFLAAVTLAAWVNFYILYIVMLITVIYFILRYIESDNKSVASFIKPFIACVISCLFAILIAGVSLFPSLMLSRESSRIGGTVSRTYTSMLYYSKAYYSELFTNLLVPDYGYLGLVLGFSGISIVSIVFLLSRKKHFSFKMSIILSAIAISFPFVSYFFNGFSGYTLRWSFYFEFIANIAIASMFPKLLTMNRKNLFKVMLVQLIYFLFVGILAFFGARIYIESILSFLIIDVVIIYFRYRPEFIHTGKYVVIVASMVFFEIIMKMVTLYFPMGSDYLNDFYNISTVQQEVGPSIIATAMKEIDDNDEYRVDIIESGFYNAVYDRNYGVRTNTNGLSSYYSYSSGEIVDFMSELGIVQQPTPFCILGMTHRTGINALLSTKYIATLEADNDHIPYGYELYDVIEIQDKNKNSTKVEVYKNQYYIPLMYTQDSYVNYEEYQSLDEIDREQAMLQGIVLDVDIDYPKTELLDNSDESIITSEILEQLKKTYQDNSNVEIYDDKIIIKKKNISLEFSFSGSKNVEYYMYFENLDYYPVSEIDYTESSDLFYDDIDGILKNELSYPVASSTIKVNNYSAIYLNSEYAQYFSGAQNAVVNCGIKTSKDGKIKMQFAQTGEYRFTNLKVVEVRTKSLQKNLKALSKNGLDNIKIQGNNITASSSYTEQKLCCVNIPFSKGWSAYIDGEEIEILNANSMLMAIMIPSGEHEITFVYRTLGLKIGVLCTIIGVLCLVLLVAVAHIVRRIKGKGFVCFLF